MTRAVRTSACNCTVFSFTKIEHELIFLITQELMGANHDSQTYFYRVSAVNAAGECELSEEVSVTPSQPPQAVSTRPL